MEAVKELVFVGVWAGHGAATTASQGSGGESEAEAHPEGGHQAQGGPFSS